VRILLISTYIDSLYPCKLLVSFSIIIHHSVSKSDVQGTTNTISIYSAQTSPSSSSFGIQPHIYSTNKWTTINMSKAIMLQKNLCPALYSCGEVLGTSDYGSRRKPCKQMRERRISDPTSTSVWYIIAKGQTFLTDTASDFFSQTYILRVCTIQNQDQVPNPKERCYRNITFHAWNRKKARIKTIHKTEPVELVHTKTRLKQKFALESFMSSAVSLSSSPCSSPLFAFDSSLEGERLVVITSKSTNASNFDVTQLLCSAKRKISKRWDDIS